MPTKVSTESPSYAKDTGDETKTLKKKLIRKDMKKAKAHIVRASKDYPRRLIMEAN